MGGLAEELAAADFAHAHVRLSLPGNASAPLCRKMSSELAFLRL